MSVSFDDLGLAPAVLKAIKTVGYETPSPIQAESIPPLLEGRDLLGQAQTGTGKTAAFALPLLSRLDLKQKSPQILVLAPTRELAIQVAEAMQKYAHDLPGFHILPIYGGQSMGQQLRQLKRGVQVVVGTPGRIIDHLGRKSLDLSALKAVVLDEADEMLRMGFIDDVDQILTHTPDERQVALFSATMPPRIKSIALRHLHDPVEIKIAAKTSTVESITQRYWEVRGTNKLDALTRILEAEDSDGIIIFVRTKNSTEELAERLSARGYTSAALNGDLNQQQREKTVEKLKDGKLDIIVATDVAARGLDVPRISHVINYDIPHDTESYVHRIGRTGRAGRSGEAILFVSPRERRMLRSIEHATKQKVTQMNLPTTQEISERRVEHFKRSVADGIEANDLTFFRKLMTDFVEEHALDMTDAAAALAYLLQRDYPLQPAFKDERRLPLAEQGERRSRGNDRPERGERGERGRPDRGEGRKRLRMSDEESREPPVDIDMRTFRLAVGREHGVEPKHIVGAIANEIGLDSEFIQGIQIRDNFTLLDLPDGMPKEVMQHLKKVRVCGQALGIRVDEGAPEQRERGDRPNKRGGKPGARPNVRPKGGAGGKPPRKSEGRPGGKDFSKAKKRKPKPKPSKSGGAPRNDGKRPPKRS